MIQDHLKALITEALQKMHGDKIVARPSEAEVNIERPGRAAHGDFTTNIALELSGEYGIPPRQIAERILERLPKSGEIARVEIAGPGFINFFLTPSWLYETIVEIATKREEFGRSEVGKGTKIQVEYGSANPTGPIHVGNARNIVYGDALASLLEAVGYTAERENYINDMGGQMERFTLSLEARYLQALGLRGEVPEDGYQGEYLIDLGKQLALEEGMGFVDNREAIRKWGLGKVIEAQERTLERLRVVYDHWMFESSLHESGKIDAAIQRLREGGHVYEQDGAVWFRATSFGHTQDRVIVKSLEKGGTPTYLAADTAYLLDKLERGFDHLIYFWGADHHGTVENLMSVARALGVDDHVEVLLYQWVNFTGGVMGRRHGTFITLDELVDEVGVDAARYTFLTRSPEAAMVFDFDLVKSQSQENPVYYVQYAHARIRSLIRYGEEKGIELGTVEEADLSLLTHESEHELVRKLSEFPQMLEVASRLRAPYRLTAYAQDVAALFHSFYRDCRVIGDDPQLTKARLWLSEVTREVIANTLTILGVRAPERM